MNHKETPITFLSLFGILPTLFRSSLMHGRNKRDLKRSIDERRVKIQEETRFEVISEISRDSAFRNTKNYLITPLQCRDLWENKTEFQNL